MPARVGLCIVVRPLSGCVLSLAIVRVAARGSIRNFGSMQNFKKSGIFPENPEIPENPENPENAPEISENR